MSHTQTKTLTVFAPAKLNLYLHVTGRLDNGYHTLDSLIGFVDVGDSIEISPSSSGFGFDIQGPFATHFEERERDAGPRSSNLVVRAAWALARAAEKAPDVHVRLTKALPLGAGLGGGSSDAAALIWGLLEWWNIPRRAHYLPGLMARLGADIPVCLPCQNARIRGIGDILDPAPDIPETPVVLVNPGKPCFTADIFTRFAAEFKQPQPLPEHFKNFDDFISFLGCSTNDLLDSACQAVPEIQNVINTLTAQKNCALARMSGSGASSFGLFEHEKDAVQAARVIAEENPDWWVKFGWLGRPERY